MQRSKHSILRWRVGGWVDGWMGEWVGGWMGGWGMKSNWNIRFILRSSRSLSKFSKFSTTSKLYKIWDIVNHDLFSTTIGDNNSETLHIHKCVLNESLSFHISAHLGKLPVMRGLENVEIDASLVRFSAILRIQYFEQQISVSKPLKKKWISTNQN